MKVETTNLTSLPFCLAVIGFRTQEIAVQVRDRNLRCTNRTFISLIQYVYINRSVTDGEYRLTSNKLSIVQRTDEK